MERRAFQSRSILWRGRRGGNNPHAFRVWVALALLVVAAATACGEESLEWMTLDSPVIVRGSVIAISGAPLPRTETSSVVTVRVKETLKGPKSELVRFFAEPLDHNWRPGERLFFLNAASPVEE